MIKAFSEKRLSLKNQASIRPERHFNCGAILKMKTTPRGDKYGDLLLY